MFKNHLFFFSNKGKDGNWKAFGKLENTHEFKGHISLLDEEIIGCGNKLSKMNSVSKKELQIKNPFEEIFLTLMMFPEYSKTNGVQTC